ncbi:hypothetical protein HGO34_13395 [Agrobacterium vitis]|uniref:TRASH domain-containing protein n=1 Tax=Agrobacterium vitis TaxID=373 RepID=A0AAE4WED6_AGRVI|nr:hypothetical protein [Agrobacterium vitis]MCF1499642.1 hypothetical protein [Allorhizobium sp. Av2]MCM2440710.1 hypothetical protein [Agrobacterium vitis]MUZ59311.1 hypothetical protein [Agrobacterium vitis]MVA66542.1 hypothetical protein [Agrobacterium vitis]MVA87403.1 hypothetical protein [Agrobacterium vitis]
MAYLDNYLKARNERLGTQHKAKSRKTKQRQIIKGDRRKHVIDKVMDTLSDWRYSPFEHEGPCHTGLRSALCMEGYSWSLSNTEAGNIVGEALRLTGAKRPSWDQGQPEYLLAYDVCSGCHGPMPEDMITGGRRGRFCSDECARSFLVKRDFTSSLHASRIEASAFSLINRDRRPLRTCENCGDQYRGFSRNDHSQKYCSRNCYGQAKRKLQQQDCPICSKGFHPLHEGQVHCSWACLRQMKLEKTCVVCKQNFNAKSKKAIYCSEKCRSYHVRHGQGGEVPLVGVPRACTCQHCNVEFEVMNARPKKYCSNKCARAVEKLIRQQRNKAPQSNIIYLTAEIFDGWFKQAA